MRPAPSPVAKLLTGALVALLAACAASPAGSIRAGASPKAGKAAAPAKAGPPKPAASASVAVAASARPAGGKLARPAGAVLALAGQVKVDAAYAASVGGTLISDHGGALVANNGGGIVALGARLDGGKLLGNNGGSLIADAAGNVVAPGEGGVAGDLGGGLLVANNGGGLVSNNGGGLISDRGGALVSKTKLRLLQAEGPAAGPAVGTEARAAGMLVSVVSLRDRRYLPLGEDAAGNPAYAVYTNAQGGWEVFVPAAEKGNLLVVVGAPGDPDRRLAYNVVTPAAGAGAQVDELSALASRYLRGTFTGRLADLVVMPAFTQEMLEGDPTTTTAAKKVFADAFALLAAAAAKGGIDASTDPAVVRAKAQRVVDAGLADLDVEGIMIDDEIVADWEAPPTPAMASMRKGLQTLLDGTTRRLAADPAFFSPAFLEDVINAPFVPGGTQVPLSARHEILKPADFGEFMLTEYFGQIRFGAVTSVQRAFRMALGGAAPRDPDPDLTLEGRVVAANNEFRGAVGAVMIGLCRRIVADPAVQARAEAIFAEPVPPAP